MPSGRLIKTTLLESSSAYGKAESMLHWWMLYLLRLVKREPIVEWPAGMFSGLQSSQTPSA